MSELATFGGYGAGGLDLLDQDPRKLRKSPVGRAMVRVQEQGLVRAVQVGVEERLMDVKLAAAGSIGRTAQSEVAFLSQMEAHLIQACGTEVAAQRIDAIANITAMGIAELTADGINRLRRM